MKVGKLLLVRPAFFLIYLEEDEGNEQIKGIILQYRHSITIGWDCGCWRWSGISD